MKFRHQAPIRWSDLDAQGHINNVVFVDYLQEARVGFLRSGQASDLLDAGVVVVSHSLTYIAPIEYSSEPVEIALGVSKLGGARLEIDYAISHDDTLCATARTVLCAFDFETQLPRRFNEAEREFFKEHLFEPEPLRDLAAPDLAGQGYRTDCVVRWSDLDSYGHVNNVKFFDYVMQARIEMTTSVDPSMARTGAGDSEHSWLVVRQDLAYLNQLDHRMAPYSVRTAVGKLGRTSLTLIAELADEEKVYCRAATVLVCADENGRPKQLPELTKQRLTPWLLS